jgi:carbonic anhydrase
MEESVSTNKFGIDYEFSETHTLIKRHYQELHVHFLDAAGVLKLWVDNSSLIYQPQYMSFKFPGEHLYNGKRYPGEVLIHFTEMNPNRKTWVSNGLKMSIPLNPTKNGPNLAFFEDLNPDFWRMGIKQAGEYQPKKVLEKTPLKFDLGALFRNVSIKNPSYYFYVGSQTTPPCLPNVLYVIVSTPIELANCQFKVIRENCLLTDRPKEIHARLPQDLKGRKVYQITKSQMKFAPQIRSVIPQLTRKYAVYNRVIKKTLGIGKRTSFKVALKKMKSCVVSGAGSSSKKLATFVIKQPLRPKTLKALNRHIKKLNKKTIKAMRMRGPGAKQYRKEVLAQVRAETGTMNCDKI